SGEYQEDFSAIRKGAESDHWLCCFHVAQSRFILCRPLNVSRLRSNKFLVLCLNGRVQSNLPCKEQGKIQESGQACCARTFRVGKFAHCRAHPDRFARRICPPYEFPSSVCMKKPGAVSRPG